VQQVSESVSLLVRANAEKRSAIKPNTRFCNRTARGSRRRFAAPKRTIQTPRLCRPPQSSFQWRRRKRSQWKGNASVAQHWFSNPSHHQRIWENKTIIIICSTIHRIIKHDLRAFLRSTALRRCCTPEPNVPFCNRKARRSKRQNIRSNGEDERSFSAILLPMSTMRPKNVGTAMERRRNVLLNSILQPPIPSDCSKVVRTSKTVPQKDLVKPARYTPTNR